MRLARCVRDAAVEHFTESDWVDLGLEIGNVDAVKNHGRLLRALSFQDPDYSSSAWDVIKTLAESYGIDDTPWVDVDRNLRLMVLFIRERGYELELPETQDRVSNSSALGDSDAYKVIRTIIQGNRSISLKFRTETEASFADALMRRRYSFLPQCSLVYYSAQYDAARVREPDFIVFKNGWAIQIEIDGSSHDHVPAYKDQDKTDPLTSQGVISRRIDATRVSNGTSEQSQRDREAWAERELDKLEGYIQQHTKSLTRS